MAGANVNMKVTTATGTNRKGVVALVGIPGSGKTTSALILAYGMLARKHPELMKDAKRDAKGRYRDYSAVGHLIGVISTEGSRDELSANRIFTNPFDQYSFKIGQHLKVNLSMYSADAYIAAKNLLKQAGCEVIIVDSASHYWQWATEVQNTIVKNNPKANFSSWNDIKVYTKKFIDAFAYDNEIDVILTMRQKVAWDLSGGAPKRVGEKADMKQDISFEFQVELQIEPKTHTITINKDNSNLFSDGDIIDPTLGIYYYYWLNGKLSDRKVMQLKVQRLVKRFGAEKVVNLYTTWAQLNQVPNIQITKDGVVMNTPIPSTELDDIDYAQFYDYLVNELTRKIETEIDL